MISRLTNPSLVVRIMWAYATYIVLILAAFAVGYFFLPRGALLNTPWSALGVIAASPQSPLAQFLATLGFNLAFALVLGVGLNLQRVNGFPAGYLFIFSAAVVSGITAGTNSFVSQVISPYTLEGWLVALRIQHIELLGYTIIVASTISVAVSEYSSWLPWKAKETRVQNWRDIRLARREVIGLIAGIVLIVLGAYNETMLAL